MFKTVKRYDNLGSQASLTSFIACAHSNAWLPSTLGAGRHHHKNQHIRLSMTAPGSADIGSSDTNLFIKLYLANLIPLKVVGEYHSNT